MVGFRSGSEKMDRFNKTKSLSSQYDYVYEEDALLGNPTREHAPN